MADDSELQVEQREVCVKWKIKDVFSTKKYLKSSFFSLSDGKFLLSLYLNGESEDSDFDDSDVSENYDGFICLYLRMESSTSQCHRVAFRLGILQANGSVYKPNEMITYTFCEGDGYGLRELIRFGDLVVRKDSLAPNNCLTVFCYAQLQDSEMEENDFEISMSKRRKLDPSSFEIGQADSEDLLISGRDSDVTIKIGDQELKAHRCILTTHSPVFCSMFQHDTKEKQTGIVIIEDCDHDSFKHFLSFLYTKNLDVCSSNVFDLYKISSRYLVNDLKNECVRYLAKELCAETFSDIFLLATMHNDSKLLEIATDFFINNFKEIFLTSTWQSFLNEHTTLANDILVKFAKSRDPRLGPIWVKIISLHTRHEPVSKTASD